MIVFIFSVKYEVITDREDALFAGDGRTEETLNSYLNKKGKLTRGF